MDNIVQRVNALSIANSTLNKNIGYFLYSEIVNTGKNPTETLKNPPQIQSESCLTDNVCHHTQLFIKVAVTFNKAPFNGCVGEKMCTQCQGCQDHADKISIDCSLGAPGVGIEEGMPFSPPSGGKPIC